MKKIFIVVLVLSLLMNVAQAARVIQLRDELVHQIRQSLAHDAFTEDLIGRYDVALEQCIAAKK